jgi:hypothetical protein
MIDINSFPHGIHCLSLDYDSCYYLIKIRVAIPDNTPEGDAIIMLREYLNQELPSGFHVDIYIQRFVSVMEYTPSTYNNLYQAPTTLFSFSTESSSRDEFQRAATYFTKDMGSSSPKQFTAQQAMNLIEKMKKNPKLEVKPKEPKKDLIIDSLF